MPEAPNVHNLLLILAKDLASRLATPVFVVDREGTLLYFNEAAEPVLGVSYPEVGGLPREKWAAMFEPRDDDDSLLPLEELPMAKAIADHVPSHRSFTITAGDGERRQIAVTAVPLFAHADEFVGAVALFWEDTDS